MHTDGVEDHVCLERDFFAGFEGLTDLLQIRTFLDGWGVDLDADLGALVEGGEFDVSLAEDQDPEDLREFVDPAEGGDGARFRGSVSPPR